jgi:hypothetical protein
MINIFLKILKSYKIKKDRILFIINDNILNNDTLIKCINNTLNILKNEFD